MIERQSERLDVPQTHIVQAALREYFERKGLLLPNIICNQVDILDGISSKDDPLPKRLVFYGVLLGQYHEKIAPLTKRTWKIYMTESRQFVLTRTTQIRPDSLVGRIHPIREGRICLEKKKYCTEYRYWILKDVNDQAFVPVYELDGENVPAQVVENARHGIELLRTPAIDLHQAAQDAKVLAPKIVREYTSIVSSEL